MLLFMVYIITIISFRHKSIDKMTRYWYILFTIILRLGLFSKKDSIICTLNWYRINIISKQKVKILIIDHKNDYLW